MDGPDRKDTEHVVLRTATGTVPLGFVRERDRVYLVARERGAQWPIDLLREGTASLGLPDGNGAGTVTLVSQPAEQVRILSLFRERYGQERFERWYAHPARVLEVDLAAGPLDASSTERYYRWLGAEFDNVADDYDRHITGNRMNRLLRDRSLAILRATFRGRRSLLEVGCGSGMETLPLLREGHEVHAVDISDRMLAVVRRKAAAEGLTERLRTTALRASSLDRLAAEVGESAFDGAYSTYGALNCENDLSPLPGAFHRLLRADSSLVLGIYNRWCLFELVAYSLTLQGHRALGRRKNPVRVGSSRFCIDVYAYSVADFERLFSAAFVRTGLEGVPVLLPPSDLTQYAERFSRHFGQLSGWDRAIGRKWPFSTLGDHFLLSLRRRAGNVRDPRRYA